VVVACILVRILRLNSISGSCDGFAAFPYHSARVELF
jgi:hypothetical protein